MDHFKNVLGELEKAVELEKVHELEKVRQLAKNLKV